MKWNQKGIIACVVLFFVIIGALMVQGVQQTNNQEDGQFQLIDCPHLITVTIGGDSFQDYSSINVISELDTFFSFSRLSSTSSVSPS